MRREKRGYYIAVEGRGEREVGREECCCLVGTGSGGVEGEFWGVRGVGNGEWGK